MPSSPKRKSETTPAHPDDSKKPRLSSPEEAQEMPLANPTAAADSHIDHAKAIAYWSGTEASVAGVLGGYPQVSRADLQGSANFLAKLRRASTNPRLNGTEQKRLRRVVDCGAGIGRITDGFLTGVAETVDIVEPVQTFTAQIAAKNVGRIYNVGLEGWFPEKELAGEGERYDVIWTQWCVGQLTDTQLVDYLRRMQKVLSPGGWIVVKENLSNHHLGEDVYDETDSSVTRTDDKFRKLFTDARLAIAATEIQRGMPKGLYPVRSYALQPR